MSIDIPLSRVGCSTLPLTHWRLPEALDRIQSLGVGGWELPIRGDGVHLGHLDPAELMRNPSLADVICAQARAFTGLALLGAGFEISRTSPLAREIAHFSACAKVLERLECPVVTIFVFDDGAVEPVARYQALLQVARRHGLTLCVETHMGTATQHSAAAKRIADSLGCSLTLDHSHYVSQGYSLEDVAPLLPHVRHIQVRGCGAGSIETVVRSEEEKADLRRALEAIIPPRYDGYVCIEYIDRATDWFPSIRNIVEILRPPQRDGRGPGRAPPGSASRP